MQHPNVEGLNSDDFSGVFYLDGRVGLGEHLALVGELPYVDIRPNGGTANDYYYYGDDFGASVGNPYLGLETKSSTSPIFVELGFRAPLADEDQWISLLVGQVVDQSRWNAFLANRSSIQAAFNLREVTPQHIAYRLRLSPVLTMPSDGGDTDLWGQYAFDVAYQGSWARIGAGMSGNMLLTDDYGNLGTRAESQIDLHGDFLSGPIRPGLSVRLPMGAPANLVPVVVGFTLSFVN
jgi:hypothetical protein